MDNQRLMVWAAFGLMLWLTYQAWQQDYGPRPVAEPALVSEPAADAGVDTSTLPELDAAPLPAESLPDLDAGTPVDNAPPAVDAGELIVVETDVVHYEISTRGGSIVRATMLGYPVAKDRPDDLVTLLSPGTDNLGILRTGLRSTGAAPDHEAIFSVPSTRFELNGSDELRVPLTWDSGDGVRVTKTFIFRRGLYRVDVEQRVENGSQAPWTADQYSQILRRSYEQERSMFDVGSYSFDGPLLFDGKKADKLDRGDLQEAAETFTGPNGYFAAMTASTVGARQTIAPGAEHTFARTFFIGPKLQEQLEEIEPKLKLSVDYGFLTILSQPMFWLLSWVYGFVGNWGWAIIIVTFLIKLAFYKLTETSGRRSPRP